MNQASLEYECAVIGGGPAGLTAALYLGRFRRRVALIQSGTPRAAWIPKTRNLIGYHGGISGISLLRRLHRQIADLGVPVIRAEAELQRSPKGFLLKCGSQTLLAQKVILATGIQDKQPDLPNLVPMRKLGLLRYCPVCDGFEFSRKKLMLLVGKGDNLGKIRFLLRYSRDLTVIGPVGYSLSPQRRKIFRKLKIRYIKADLERVEAFGRGVKALLKNGKQFLADAAYIELGFRVNNSAFAKLKKLRKTKSGLLLTDKDQRTSIPGLFAIGDCTPGLAQIAVAAGQAAVAATAAHNELLENTRPGKRH